MPTLEPYANYLRAALVILIGVSLGFALTLAALRSGYGFDPLEVGPWTAWPEIGGPDVDPYARAVIARSGEAPLAKEQGLVFVARADSAGEALDGNCNYVITDPTPPTRYWTIDLAAPDGGVIDWPGGRRGFTSVEVLRREGGAFEIAVSRQTQPGNWLSPGAARRFTVVLRLYDVGLDAAARPDASVFPKILRRGCA
jgi:hypothetical protein